MARGGIQDNKKTRFHHNNLASHKYVPDKLNPDWCRFRTGGACCFAGEVLAEDAGVTVFGVTETSQTGPSYRPRGTPLSSAS